ncbi:MAG: hypothetical protein ACK55Q_22840 [Dolichospermum sp.]|jgi:hypothetical protein
MNINKFPKSKGVYFKLSPEELNRLYEITNDLNIGNSHFLRMCIDLFWVQLQVEKGIESGKVKIDDQVYDLNLVELAKFQQEMAQIFAQVNWADLITQQTKAPLKRFKKPFKQAS